MSEEYLPLTDEERTFRVEGARQSVGMPGSAGMLRWDATVCQLETGLAAVTAERDDLKELADYLLAGRNPDYEGPADYIELRDVLLGHADAGPDSEGAWRAISRLASAQEAVAP